MIHNQHFAVIAANKSVPSIKKEEMLCSAKAMQCGMAA